MRGASRAFAIALGVVLAGAAGAQSLTEYGAAAAGGTAGGAAGKQVSQGLTAIFGKVDQQTKAAAKEAKEEKPAAAPSPAPVSISPASPNVAPSGSASSKPAPSAAAPSPAPTPKKSRAAKIARATRPPRQDQPYNVPDPPAVPSHSAGIANKAPERHVEPQPVAEPAPLPPPPPAPQMTADELKAIAQGTSREDVLKLGVPAARITMFGDDGHLLEIYDYAIHDHAAKGFTFGVVRFSDGAVSQVELR